MAGSKRKIKQAEPCSKTKYKVSHPFWRIVTSVILLAGLSLACNLPGIRRAAPGPTAPPPTATIPLPTLTPTPLAREVSIQNGTITLALQSQSKVIRLDPPDGGDISGLKASMADLRSAALLIVTDPAGNYLSEYRWITATDPQNTSVLLKPAQYSPYSQYNVNAIDLSGLLETRKGETSLNTLKETLQSLGLPVDFGLILVQPDPFSDVQAMTLYQTPIPEIVVALPTAMEGQATVDSAMILTIHDLSALPSLADLLVSQTQKISLANLTGLGMKDLADLQIKSVNKLEKPEETAGYFGETKLEVKYNLKQVKEFTYYINNVVVIDQPCGSQDMEGRIFAMDPPAGSEVIPKDARITVYRCEVVSDQPPKVVNLQIAPQAEACDLKPLNGLMDVALVIDISGSMEGSGLASAKAAGISFIKKLNPENAQVGLAIFESDARVLSQLTDDFDRVIGLISGLSATGGTAIDKGLTAGFSIVQASKRPDVPKVVLLLSDGNSEAEPALQAAGEIKAAGISILTIGVGSANQNLLSGIASSKSESAYSPTSQALKQTFDKQALRLEYSGQPAARNVVARFKINLDHYALLENLLDQDARLVSVDTIEWQIAEVFPTEVVELPVVLRPLDASTDQPYGTLEVSYDQCSSGPNTSLPPQLITEAALESTTPTTTRLVIEYEQEQTGTLTEFQSVTFLLDPNTPGIFSVTTQGAGSELAPEIFARDGKEKLYPLYYVWKPEEKKRISTFYIEEPQSYWLYIQSNSLSDVGEYKAIVQRGEAITPLPLEVGAAPVDVDLQPFDAQVYDLRGLGPDDRITVVMTQTGGYMVSYPGLISLDGKNPSGNLIYDFWGENTLTSVYQPQGEGPYRLFLPNEISDSSQFQLQVIPGDPFSVPMGSLTPGTQAQGQFGEDTVQIWTFEGKKGQGFDLSLTFQTQNQYTYLYLTIFNPDSSRLTSGTSDGSYHTGWTELSQDGTYTLLINGYTSDKALDYTLELKQKDLPEPTLIEVKSGDQLTGTAINRRADMYLIKITPGQVLSVTMKLSTSEGSGTLYLVDPLGQASLFATSLNGELTFGPITIHYAGEYTLKLFTYTNEDATYEISFELN